MQQTEDLALRMCIIFIIPVRQMSTLLFVKCVLLQNESILFVSVPSLLS